jgi:signal transduction histidine kinase/DNA-binding CsgD family transcriptional regulator
MKQEFTEKRAISGCSLRALRPRAGIFALCIMKAETERYYSIRESNSMVTSDRLLRFIARLQSERTIAHGRNALLRYIRRSSGAQQVALFVLDKERQELVLLAQSGRSSQSGQSGRRPSDASQGSGASPAARARHGAKRLPASGLFGSALLAQGLLQISDLSADSRTLPQEENWGWPRGRALLSAIRAGDQPDTEQGVLLVCFAPEEDGDAQDRKITQKASAGQNEGDLLVCITLLSAYLSRTDKRTPATRSKPASRRAKRTDRSGSEEQELPVLVEAPSVDKRENEEDEQLCTLPEVLYSLSSLSELYELGLIVNMDTEVQELYRHLLTHLGRVIRATGACLLLYYPFQWRFILAASQGDALAWRTLANTLDGVEIERLAMRGPGETLTSIVIDGQRLLLITLSYNCALLGVVVLAVADEAVLLDERGLLLSYMGKIAALILRNYDLRIAEQKAVVDHERSRIARDIHDGAAQHVAHVLTRLELVQRIFERQPQQALAEVKQAYALLRVSLDELRHGIASLLPAQLEAQSFATALQGLLDEYRTNNPGVEIAYSIDDLTQLPSTLEAPIFRLMQEALTNIQKHARATRISALIRVLPGMLLVEVSDNGVGFRPEQVMGFSGGVTIKKGGAEAVWHVGLRTMRERVQEAGGHWEIQSSTGQGTTVKARFPLPVPGVSTPLTAREREVLRLIVQGLTNRDIAARLYISVETVKSHVHHIVQKMRVKDRTQAAVLATRQGWLNA